MQKSYYFPHDYSAHTDVKILFLRQQLGMEGYGIYWFIIEQLAIAGGVMPMKIIPVLAMQMQVTETKVQGVITKFDLFTVTDENFFSLRLKKFLKVRKNISGKRKEVALKRWESKDSKDAIALQLDSNSNIKERKGKEIKERKTKESIYPELDGVVSYFLENGYSEKAAEKAYRYYADAGWVDSKGTKVRNWKQKMQSVWFKDENRSVTQAPVLTLKNLQDEIIRIEQGFTSTNS